MAIASGTAVIADSVSVEYAGQVFEYAFDGLGHGQVKSSSDATQCAGLFEGYLWRVAMG